jgi:Caspase domain
VASSSNSGQVHTTNEAANLNNIAILIANASYQSMPQLDCCREDLAAMTKLIESTGRFGSIHPIINANADLIRSTIRGALANATEVDEIFFYYSGHGEIVGSEFFFCGTDFANAHPHKTGVSHDALHGLLRSSSPGLLVKIVDACSSGTLLVKSDIPFLPTSKDGFKNVIQMASSLNSQSSLTGHPLSEFTQAFCNACIQKIDGTIYYGDIANSIKDAFLNHETQTLHFVTQGTGLEVFVENADRLSAFRSSYEEKWSPPAAKKEHQTILTAGDGASSNGTKLLLAAEQKIATPEIADRFICGLFDRIHKNLVERDFDDYFGNYILD